MTRVHNKVVLWDSQYTEDEEGPKNMKIAIKRRKLEEVLE